MSVSDCAVLAADAVVPAAVSAPKEASLAGAARRGRWSRQALADVVAAADLVAVTLAGLVPAALYNQSHASDLDWQRTLQASLIAGILAVLCLKSVDMYDRSRIHDFPRRFSPIAGNTLIAIAAIVGIVLPASAGSADWWIWAGLWFVVATTLVAAIHNIAHVVFRRLTSTGRFDRQVAVFGAGPIARRIHDHIAANDLGARFAGLYDDRKDQDRIDPMGLDVVGRLADLVAAARERRVDKVIIALPQLADGRIADIARRFEGTDATVHIVTHIASDVVGKPRAHNVSNIGHVGLLDVRTSEPRHGWRAMFATA